MKPPEDLVVFIDRSLGKQIIASTLRAAGYSVEVHDEHFPPDALDEVWLSEVSRRGWVVFTKDKRIRYRAPELAAVRVTRARLFTLTAGSIQAQEMADIFLRAMGKYKSLLPKRSRPTLLLSAGPERCRKFTPNEGLPDSLGDCGFQPDVSENCDNVF